ncbi:amidohydrolase [Sphingomonas sp. BT-65]|uniref:amidohydrolase n=1 Tax=Sphingomonas sp. BT-65 TaxID=2989821 RepID=UPI00223627A7|nr:amidohydrolase [Sphingomonas sp. BT-65]MCW4460918.1 amidohydrolase [Sphingomonas sp. BT-65]
MPRALMSLVMGVAVAAPGVAQASDPAAQRARIDATVAAEYPALEATYKDLHRNPELAFAETRTAAILAKQMRALGFEVTEKVGKTGVVAVLRNGAGPTVMVRTDMDALPMQEKTGLSYASKVQTQIDGKPVFVAHSCGHDVHMAWWLGAAEALASMKSEWRGTLVFVAQPAEETGKGAAAMITDGLFTRFPRPDYGFAAHIGNRTAGTVLIKDGPHSSAADLFRVTFIGKGGHGARPHLAIDPIVMGAHFVSDIQAVVSREKDPNVAGVLTVGSFISGSAGNIIPDQAVLELTTRTFSADARRIMATGVQRTAKAAADMAGAGAPKVELIAGTPALFNNPELTPRAATVLKAAFGDNRINYIAPAEPGSPTSEDYAEFAAAGVPSVYFNIGGGDPEANARAKAGGPPLPANHSPEFTVLPEPAIKTGAAVLSLAVLMVAGRDVPQVAADGK